MSKLFLDIFNISIAASWMIGAVILLRLAMKKRAPKWTVCLLWAVVAVRLLIPFGFESELSLVPSKETIKPEAVYTETAPRLPSTQSPSHNPEIPKDDFEKKPAIYIESGFEIIDKPVNDVIVNAVEKIPQEAENPFKKVIDIASIIWACGMGVMIIYAMINYLLLKKRISVFVPDENGIRRSESVGSPFILGVFKPKIYLPFGLSAHTESYVIAHENAHLKRKDHLIKPFGYALLTVYWFNPLIWIAYILLCRDIEMACDEKVVKNMNDEARKAYASALLECGIKHSVIAACPVAFGEIGVKQRVKNALNYKKPMFWIVLVAVTACIAVAVFFLTNPLSQTDTSSENSEVSGNETDPHRDKHNISNESTLKTDFQYDEKQYYNEALDDIWAMCEYLFTKDYDRYIQNERFACPSDDAVFQSKWNNMLESCLNDAKEAQQEDKFFRSFIDITGNSTPELIFANANYEIKAIYTLKNNKPVLIAVFDNWARLLTDGGIYTFDAEKGYKVLTYHDGELTENDPRGNEVIFQNYNLWYSMKNISFEPTPIIEGSEYYEGFQLTLSDDETHYSITDYIQGETDLVIPRSYNGIPITVIAKNAFHNDSFETVIIPEGITHIEESVFSFSDFTSIKLPNSLVYIGKEAFRHSEIEKIIIPNNVTYMGERAFSECNNLKSVVIENGIELIPEGAFAWCFNLEKISIPESVKVIEKEAFLCCRSIDEIDVSASNSVYYNPGNCLVETATKTLILASRNMNISDGQVNAFGESSVFCGKLETLYVPASVISIHENAFKYFDVDHIIVDPENPVYHSAGDCLIETATGKLIRGSNNSVIPHDGSVTSIAHSAFETCLELESIIIPSSVKSIGYGAFTICDKLKNVEISEGVVSIGNGAFGRCIALESINIPESVTVMEDHIFYECSESLNINCHAEAKPEGWSEMWLGCYALVSWNGKPEVSEPETSEPETSEPEVSEPEVSEPETSEQVFVPHPIQYAAYNFMPTLTAEARKEMRGAEEGAINTGRLFVIHSKHGLEELAKNCVFSEYDQFKDDFQRFVEATDDAYFDEYSLLIQYVWSPNLMTRYKIRRVWLEEDLVTLLYDAIPHDGASPQLVQDNFLVAEVKKTEIADYTTFSSDPNIITAPKKEIDNSQRDVDFSVVKLHESMEIFDNAYYYENTNYWMKQQLFTVTSFEELEALQSFCHDSSSSYGFGDFIKDIPEDFFDKKAFIFVYATSSSGGDVLYIDSIKTNKGKLEVNMNICHCGTTEDIYQRLFAVDVDRNVIDTCNEFVLNENIIQYDDLPDLYKPFG